MACRNFGRIDRGQELFTNTARRNAPASEYLALCLEQSFREIFSADQEDLQRAFDRTEVYLRMIATDAAIHAPETVHQAGAFSGLFVYRSGRPWEDTSKRLERQIMSEMVRAEEEWPLVKAGLFGRSYQRAENSVDKYVGQLDAARSDRW
ncbi:hypothetical protein GCM10009836_20390 [Pseudonocardia ailaonensis]|uniref:Uncharacterized protein n=1 Tax=Pseudonocardia ailaonensis TaxID=367279 RepID=A0ABN2MW18_9PSEU